MREKNTYLEVEIKTEENRWQLTSQELFEIVMRKNKKRHFLFASKVIGKYIAVHPYTPILIGRFLAMCFLDEVRGEKEGREQKLEQEIKETLEYWRSLPTPEEFEEIVQQQYLLKKKTLFIGFAETATGLGQSVFGCFKGQSAYLHTTRVDLVGEEPNFKFYEEHSHAMNHRCYIRALDDLEAYERVVLIDDELTTGKTALNFIRAIVRDLSVKEFVVLSILDWRAASDLKQFEEMEEELGITIQCISLLKGEIHAQLIGNLDEVQSNNEEISWQEERLKLHRGETIHEAMLPYAEGTAYTQGTYETIYKPFMKYVTLETLGSDQVIRRSRYMQTATGRFGLTGEQNVSLQEKLKDIGKELKAMRSGKKCLCLGTEEFIYIPNQIACFMGENVYFECSARSPIVTLDEPDYVLKHALTYKSPEDEALPIYLYNIENQGYEEVFWFLERDIENHFKRAMCQALYKKGIQKVYFIVL